VKFADLLEGERRLEVRLEGIAPTFKSWIHTLILSTTKVMQLALTLPVDVGSAEKLFSNAS